MSRNKKDTRNKIFAAVKEHKQTTAEISKAANVGHTTAKDHLNEMAKLGMIVKTTMRISIGTSTWKQIKVVAGWKLKVDNNGNTN